MLDLVPIENNASISMFLWLGWLIYCSFILCCAMCIASSDNRGRKSPARLTKSHIKDLWAASWSQIRSACKTRVCQKSILMALWNLCSKGFRKCTLFEVILLKMHHWSPWAPSCLESSMQLYCTPISPIKSCNPLFMWTRRKLWAHLNLCSSLYLCSCATSQPNIIPHLKSPSSQVQLK